jgi:hypothetical protein
MQLAWETDTKGNELLVLIALADNASDEGYCWPSWGTIMKKTKVSRGTLSTVLKSLESKNLIRRESRKRENGSDSSNGYFVIKGVGRSSEIEPQEFRIRTPKVQNLNPQSSEIEPLEPSREPSREPSESVEHDTRTPKYKKNEKRKLVYSNIDMGLAITMDQNIKAMTGSTKKTDLEKWANEFRMMRQLDGRDPAKLDNFLHLLATGEDRMWEFWRGNILSPQSMRKNYDKVVAQYRRDIVDANKIVDQNIPLEDRVSALARTKKA